MKRKRKAKGAAAAAAAAAAAGSTNDAAAPAPDAEPSAKGGARRRRDERRKGVLSAAPAEPVATKVTPGRRKKKSRKKEEAVAAKDSSDSDEGEEDEDSDEEDVDGESGDEGSVDVDFEFFDPKEEDYHSVGDLLKNGMWEFAGAHLNYAEIADSVVGQGNIGTLIKSTNEQDPEKDDTLCAMLTVLNLRQFASVSWPKTITSALLTKAKKHAEGEALDRIKELLGEPRKEGCEVGMLFSERFTNLPHQLIPPLHKAMVDDIEWSCTVPECPEDERPFYFFTHFVGVARCFEGAPNKSAEAEKRSAEGDTGPWFPRHEDATYYQKASSAFTFPCGGGGEKRSDEGKGKKKDGRGQELRAVFVLTKKAFKAAVMEVEKAFQESAFA